MALSSYEDISALALPLPPRPKQEENHTKILHIISITDHGIDIRSELEVHLTPSSPYAEYLPHAHNPPTLHINLSHIHAMHPLINPS